MTACTVDELRALARIDGYWLPAAILDESGDQRVDLAALRGLAVRGLVRDGVLAAELASALEPLREPRTLVEVDTETGWHAIAAGDGVTVLTGRGGGLVAVSRTGEPVRTVLMRLCDVDVSVGSGTGFEAGPDALADADDLVLAGDPIAAVHRLGRAGVPAPAATAWVRAVETRRYSAHVRAAYREGDRFVADEVRWLVGGDGTAWLTSATGAVTPIDSVALRSKLAALTEVETPCRAK